MTRTLLIDADILAYRSSSANQRSYDWGEGVTSTAANFEDAKRQAETDIIRLADQLKADAVTICLSDDFNSFRKDRVDPSYKAVRNDVERPQHLYDIKAWLRADYDSAWLPTLEADDVMGIMATEPHADERIIVSADKDLMGVPGRLYRPQLQKPGRKPVLIDITPLEAIRFHFWQTIVGDPTDGYLGARGVGKLSEYAQDVIEADSEEEAWDIVIDAYASKGFSEEDAVRQARLARMLQHGDWDGRSVRLWLPPAFEWETAEDDD